KCALRREHLVENVDRGVVKIFSDANQQRGISERRDFHAVTGSAVFRRHCFLNSLDVLFDLANTRMNFFDQIVFSLRELFDTLGEVNNFTCNVIGLVTPCMVRSPRMSPSCGPVCFTLRLLNMMSGYFSTAKNSGLRK